MAETIIELLASGEANAPAIAAPGRDPLSYEALRGDVARLAGQLRALGVERGERVAIVLPDGPELAITFLAVASCATVAPLNPAYREEEFRFYLDDLHAKALITRAGEAAEAHAAVPAGTLLAREHLAIKKPGTGIPARELSGLLGMRLVRNLQRDEMLSPTDLERLNR